MCVNTLITTIKQKSVEGLGYYFPDALGPRHWFQFADDSAVTTANEEDNQLLLNLFTKWCTWANLKIRVNKCHTFGIRKTATMACQYKPLLLVNNQRIPPVELDESFKYLGKEFNYKMSTQHKEKDLTDELSKYLTKLDSVPLHPRQKITVINRYVTSKIRWPLTIYSFSETWIKQTLDSLTLRYVRKWLHFHPGANTSHLRLPLKKIGLALTLPSDLYNKCKLTLRRILKCSRNADIKRLYNATSYKYVKHDEIVNACAKKENVKSLCSSEYERRKNEEIWANFLNLSEENVIIKHILEVSRAKYIKLWQKMIDKLPKNIYTFCRRAIVFSLANNSNLFRWKRRANPDCDLCGKKQTQHHVMSFCKTALNQARYTWRHNSVLKTIASHLQSVLTPLNASLYVDIPGYLNPSEIFESARPDLLVVWGDSVTAIELTCCFELNTKKARDYKATRYQELEKQMISNKSLKLILVEITTLGIVTRDIRMFESFLNDLGLNSDRTIIKCMEVCTRASFYIYCRRNLTWNNPDLLDFL